MVKITSQLMVRSLFLVVIVAWQHATAADDPAAALYYEELKDTRSYGKGVAAALRGSGSRKLERTEPNLHSNDKINEIYVETLPGIRIYWLRTPWSGPAKELLQSMIITKAGNLTGHTIGSDSKQSIKNRYGRPVSESASALTYHIRTMNGVDTLIFVFQRDALKQVEWRWHLD
jgi:hypothetical protein